MTYSEVKQNQYRIHDLIHSSKIVFNTLLSFFNHCEDVYISHEKIAALTGYSIRQVIRAIQQLIDNGLITRIKNGYLESNNYYLNINFYIPEIREKFCHIFNSLKTWGMTSLMRAVKFLKDKCHTIKYEYYYIINNIYEIWSPEEGFANTEQNNQKGEHQNRGVGTSIRNFNKKDMIYKKVMLRVGQFTPGFNTNYYFPRKNEEFERERAEYYMKFDIVNRNEEKSLALIHEEQARKVRERQKKNDEARAKSMRDKVYAENQLKEMADQREELEKKGGAAARFLKFAAGLGF